MVRKYKKNGFCHYNSVARVRHYGDFQTGNVASILDRKKEIIIKGKLRKERAKDFKTEYAKFIRNMNDFKAKGLARKSSDTKLFEKDKLKNLKARILSN